MPRSSTRMGDKELFLIAPEKYIAAKLTQRMKEPTLSKEALALYQI